MVSHCKMLSAHKINADGLIETTGANRVVVIFPCTIDGVALEKFLLALLLVVEINTE
jgi:hypothetical protein